MPGKTEELAAVLARALHPPLDELDSLALMDLLVHFSFHAEGRAFTNCRDDSSSELIGREDAADIAAACSSVPRDHLLSMYYGFSSRYEANAITEREMAIRIRLSSADIDVGNW